MEFPHIGANCGDKSCNMLDFLPMKCDACSQVFCRDHIHYATHNCPESYKKDNQVPVCPLCNSAIPLKKGESPDIIVGSHIDNDCQSDPARQRRKIYTNKCSVKGCKQKELIPVKCDRCQKNYCLKHRHEQDHKCEESGQSVSKAGAAAVSRAQTSTSTGPFIVNSSKSKQPEKKSNRSSQNPRMAASSLQGHMSEDEALAKALQLSLEDNPQAAAPASKKKTRQEEEDFQLAQAIAASQAENSRSHNSQGSGSSSQSQKSCSIS